METKVIRPAHTAKLTLEQPAELNRYLIQETRSRKQKLHAIVPMFFLCGCMMLVPAEFSMCALWLDDKPVTNVFLDVEVGKFALLTISLFLMFFLVCEIAMRFRQKTGRKIRFFSEGISSSSRFLPWKAILSFHLVPVITRDDLRKLVVGYDENKTLPFQFHRRDIVIRIPPFNKVVQRRRLSMILQHPVQTEGLQFELNEIRKLTALPQVKLTEQLRQTTHNDKGSWQSTVCLMMAAWLWVAACPLVAFGLNMATYPPRTSTLAVQMSENSRQLTTWLYKVFSTKDEAAAAILVIGGMFAGLGVILFGYGCWIEESLRRREISSHP